MELYRVIELLDELVGIGLGYADDLVIVVKRKFAVAISERMQIALNMLHNQKGYL